MSARIGRAGTVVAAVVIACASINACGNARGTSSVAKATDTVEFSSCEPLPDGLLSMMVPLDQAGLEPTEGTYLSPFKDGYDAIAVRLPTGELAAWVVDSTKRSPEGVLSLNLAAANVSSAPLAREPDLVAVGGSAALTKMVSCADISSSE